MSSTRTHAASAIVIVAMLAIIFSLLMSPAAWRSLFAGSGTHEARASDPIPATPSPPPVPPGGSPQMLLLVTCSFMIAADEPDPPASPVAPSLIANPTFISTPTPSSIPAAAFQDDVVVHFLIVPLHMLPPLASDWNRDGAVTMDDLWAFLNGWFAGAGDANKDGQTSTDDVYTFLNAWFDGK